MESGGRSISFGEWVHRDDGYWVLRFTVPPAAQPSHAAVEALVKRICAAVVKISPATFAEYEAEVACIMADSALAPSAPARAEEVGPRELMVFAWEKTAQRLLKHRSGPGTEFDAALRDLESLFARAITAPAPTESAPAGLDAVREEVERLRPAPIAGEPEHTPRSVVRDTIDAVLAVLDRHRATESAPDAEAARLLKTFELLAAIRPPYRRGQLSEGCVQISLETAKAVAAYLRSRAAGAPAGEQGGEAK